MTKLRLIFFSLTLGALSICAGNVYGQDGTEESKGERLDSLALYRKEVQVMKVSDEERLEEAKIAKRETRAKAKQARRIEQEANDAARESKMAFKAEKKAQKAREKANKQEKRAAKARIKAAKN